MQERDQWMEGFAKESILTAHARHDRAQLREDERTGERDYASKSPDSKDQKRGVDPLRNHVRVNEDARPDDPTDHDHGGIEQIEAARETWFTFGADLLGVGHERFHATLASTSSISS